MKTLTSKFLALFLALFLAFSLSSCSTNDEDEPIMDQQGKLELTPENLSIGDFRISKWETQTEHKFPNGITSNSLLDVNLNKVLISFNPNGTLSIFLPFINEDGKVDLEIQEGKFQIQKSSNKIYIYDVTDGLENFTLENFYIERIGNRINEIYNMSFNYYDPVLKENVTLYATQNLH